MRGEALVLRRFVPSSVPPPLFDPIRIYVVRAIRRDALFWYRTQTMQQPADTRHQQQQALCPSLNAVCCLISRTASIKYVGRRVSQGKTSSDQGRQTDCYTLQPSSFGVSRGTLLENCRQIGHGVKMPSPDVFGE